MVNFACIASDTDLGANICWMYAGLVSFFVWNMWTIPLREWYEKLGLWSRLRRYFLSILASQRGSAKSNSYDPFCGSTLFLPLHIMSLAFHFHFNIFSVNIVWKNFDQYSSLLKTPPRWLYKLISIFGPFRNFLEFCKSCQLGCLLYVKHEITKTSNVDCCIGWFCIVPGQ